MLNLHPGHAHARTHAGVLFLCLSVSLSHSLTPLTRSCTRSLTHSLTRALTHSCTHSLSLVLTHLLTLSPTHSPAPLTRSLTHSLTHSRIMCICVSTGTCAMSMAVSICRHTETCTVHRQTQHRPCTGPVLSMAVLQMGFGPVQGQICMQAVQKPTPPRTPQNLQTRPRNTEAGLKPPQTPPPQVKTPSPQSGTPKPEAPTQSGTEPDVARKPTKNDKTCVGFLAFRSGFAQFRFPVPF